MAKKDSPGHLLMWIILIISIYILFSDSLITATIIIVTLIGPVFIYTIYQMFKEGEIFRSKDSTQFNFDEYSSKNDDDEGE